jgi:hypothetical protein
MLRRTRLHGVIALAAILTLGTGVAAARAEFSIHNAKLTKRADGSWKGPATLDGVKGTLRVTGTVVLLTQETHKIHFRWKSGKRLVAGCSFTEILTRPHGIQLWDGYGQITRTSRKERKYRNLHISLHGPTRADDLGHAKITVGAYKPHPGFPVRDC